MFGDVLREGNVPMRPDTKVLRTNNEPGPHYLPVGNEERVFKAAYRQGLPILIKGPTGCGKTRFVEAMAHQLARPLITVACHDDLTQSSQRCRGRGERFL